MQVAGRIVIDAFGLGKYEPGCAIQTKELTQMLRHTRRGLAKKERASPVLPSRALASEIGRWLQNSNQTSGKSIRSVNIFF